MSRPNWPRGRGEASNLSNLEVVPKYIHPNYELILEDLTRGDTRLLKVFSLVSKNNAKAKFVARLDDGTPERVKDPELDVDIENVARDVALDFKAGRNGYAGHHTARTKDLDKRAFDVEITIPTGLVFRGTVSFNAAFSVGLAIRANATVSVDATSNPVTLPPQITRRLWAILRQLFSR
jgi:hypothetical protein